MRDHWHDGRVGGIELVLLFAAVLFGVSTQRLTGLGLALVASPLLVLIIGAQEGISLLQVIGMVVSALVFWGLRREVEWRIVPWLLIPAVVGLWPGRLMSRALPGPALEIAIGIMIIVSLVATVASDRAKIFKGRPGAVAAGLLSGFMNVTAGAAGPAIVLYKISTGWRHLAFVSTVQIYFFFLNIATLAARGMPRLSLPAWLAAAAAVGAGIVVGHYLSGRVPDSVARSLVLAVSLAGGAATIIKGLLTL